MMTINGKILSSKSLLILSSRSLVLGDDQIKEERKGKLDQHDDIRTNGLLYIFWNKKKKKNVSSFLDSHDSRSVISRHPLLVYIFSALFFLVYSDRRKKSVDSHFSTTGLTWRLKEKNKSIEGKERKKESNERSAWSRVERATRHFEVRRHCVSGFA